MYCIIDIETTGGSPKTEKITEIAIYKHDGERVVDEFVTLINPEKRIPLYITQMTGISNEMVANSPTFPEIAKKIIEITDGCTFVAHNAQFDYGFVKNEFERLGYLYQRDTLCTVKLSRKLIPGYKSYSLGNICQELKICISDRHRAAGDALATVKLFELLLTKQPFEVKKSLTDIPQISQYPILSTDVFRLLPENAGVYYLYDNMGNILFIGKALNIKNKVYSHFTTRVSKKTSQLIDRIADVSFESAGNELLASFFEYAEIKKHNPPFNPLKKKTEEQTNGGFGEESFFIIDNGRNTEEKSVIKVRQGKAFGYAYVDFTDINNQDELHELIKPLSDIDFFTDAIKKYYTSHRPLKVIKF